MQIKLRLQFARIHQILDVCYTVAMDSTFQTWKKWAKSLKRWGMTDWIVTLLKEAKPLHFLGSQAIHISTPVLALFFEKDQILAVSNVLEDPEQTKAFSSFLVEFEKKNDD